MRILRLGAAKNEYMSLLHCSSSHIPLLAGAVFSICLCTEAGVWQPKQRRTLFFLFWNYDRQRRHCAYGLLRAGLRYGISVCNSGILRCSGHLTVQLSHQPKTYPDGKNAAVDDVYIHSGNRHDAVQFHCFCNGSKHIFLRGGTTGTCALCHRATQFYYDSLPCLWYYSVLYPHRVRPKVQFHDRHQCRSVQYAPDKFCGSN